MARGLKNNVETIYTLTNVNIYEYSSLEENIETKRNSVLKLVPTITFR